MKNRVLLSALLIGGTLSCILAATPDSPRASVSLVKNGEAKMPILAGSVKESVNELRRYLKEISGAELKVEEPRQGMAGLHVGLVADFPWLKLDGADQLGPEGFIIRTDPVGSIFLVAKEPGGVHQAVTTFLQALGCRWFFPGKVWEVIPAQKTIEGAWNDRQVPSFGVQRRIGYGFGAYPPCAKDLAEWERHNRMGGPVPVAIGHTWHGLDNKADFEKHPEWFALVKGKRQPSKPCYTNPDVIKRGIDHALALAARGNAMISMTPPDGLGYCECERCQAVFQGAKPYSASGTLFAKRPDGVVVNITSETLFQFVNQVAAAVAEKYPKTRVGCYAYSAYSHPPSFKMHPNVFLETTTAFRRTPLTLAEQLETFEKIGVQSGIRAYYSVYQWDWDYPSVAKGEMSLPRLANDLRTFRKHNVQALNAEASCNWGARGVNYYLAARLLWNVNDDPRAMIADFYEKAYGPAALPMERYHVRWLGSYAAVRTKPAGKPAAEDAPAKPQDEFDNANYAAPDGFTAETLKAAYHDLDEAARLVKDEPAYRARIDHMRLYAHYLFLRIQLNEAARTKDRDKVQEAVKNETVFAARIAYTNLVHTRALIGKEFYRRFLPYKTYLEGTPEWPESTAKAVEGATGKGFRKVRSDIPDREELDRLWAEDKKTLGVP